MAGTFWDERFAGEEFVYGLQPNQFYKSLLDILEPRKILIPGEGEGRNAIYAALHGWDVYAFDSSTVGKEKALKLAEKNGVSIKYDIDDYMSFKSDEKFDVVALIFTHLSSSDRRKVHEKYVEMLSDGGTLILQTFSKEQLGHNTGGPKNLDLLFSVEELQEDFKGLKSFSASQEFAMLDEGSYHQGEAHLISARGIK